MRKVLNVAEKPKVAAEATFFLAKGTQRNTPGLSKYNPVWQFNYKVEGNTEDNMFFTSVTGHIMGLDFPMQYKNWSRTPPESLLREAGVERTVDKEKVKVAENIRNLAKKCDILILWLDCDREGEAIAFEVIEICTQANRNIEIYRAHFSAVTKRDIERAISDLKEPNKHLADAVESRQEVDLRIGAAITRFQSLLLQPRYKDLKGQPISYGPCQFPTLGFVVERWKKIQSFVAEPFWFIYCKHDTELPDRTKAAVEFIWDRKQLFEKPIAEALYDKVRQNPQAVVISVQGSEKKRWRPLPLSTIEFQKLAVGKLKIPSHRAMEIAEKLYTKGFISYPRTETDRFVNTINVKGLVELQLGHSQWGEYAQDLLHNEQYQHPRVGSHDDKAHPPIHPVKLLDRTMLGGGGGRGGGDGLANDEYRIYELITRHFLAACSKDARGIETIVRIDINGETFHTTGLIIKEYNWLLIYIYDKWNAKVLPDYRQGHIFIPSTTALRESRTTPPHPITEAELITLMDKNGIGTDATIHEHIKTIQDRGYAKKLPSQAFEPTTLGVALVSAYERMGIDLWKPNLRAAMERNMTLIANGQMTKEEFLRQCLEELEQIFLKILEKKEFMIDEVGKFYEATAGGNNFTVEPGEERKEGGLEVDCGSCDQKTLALYYLSNDRRIMSCLDCQLNLKIPRNGGITALDFKCPICSFQVLQVKNENASSYPVCPWCYNNPPEANDIEDMPNTNRSGLDMPQGMPCFKCPSTECEFAAGSLNQKLMPCTECRKNHIAIKKSKKGTYFLGCKGFPECKKTIWLSDSIVNLKILPKECPKCKLTKLVKFTFKNVNLLDNSLATRVSMEEGDEFCLAGCDNGDLSLFNYTYDLRKPTTSNQQRVSQTQLITQTQNRGQPSRMGTQLNNSANTNQLSTNSAEAARKRINILGNTSRLINNGIVQGPNAAGTMGIEPSTRSLLNENKGTGIRIAYEPPSDSRNIQSTQSLSSVNRGFELCTKCKKTGHSVGSCPNSLTSTQNAPQLGKAFRSPSNSAKPTETIKTLNTATLNTNARLIGTAGNSGRSSSSSATFPANTSSRDLAKPKENLPPSGNSAASSNCYKCQQPGHWASNCPNQTNPQRFGDNANTRGNGGFGNQSNARSNNFGNNTGNNNSRYGQTQNSNNAGNQGDYLSSVTCYKCQKKGHFANKCTETAAAPQRNASSDNSSYNNNRGRQRDEYDEYDDYGGDQPPPQQQQQPQQQKKGECFICKKEGHWSNACPNRNTNGPQQSTPSRSYGQNNSFSNSTNKPSGTLDLATITCYKCQEKGHFANKCPQGMQTEDTPSNNSFQGKRNYNSFQNRSNAAGGDGGGGGAGKSCSDCGHVGRHPKGSTCPSVKKKKPKPQDNEYD